MLTCRESDIERIHELLGAIGHPATIETIGAKLHCGTAYIHSLVDQEDSGLSFVVQSKLVRDWSVVVVAPPAWQQQFPEVK